MIQLTLPITSEYNRLIVYSFAMIFCLCVVMTYYVLINTLSTMTYMEGAGDAVLVTCIIMMFLSITAYSFYECLDILKTNIICTQRNISHQALLRTKTIEYADIVYGRLYYKSLVLIKDSHGRTIYFFKGLTHFNVITVWLQENGHIHAA